MNFLLLLPLLAALTDAALLKKRENLVAELFQEIDYTYAVGYAPELTSTELVDVSTHYFTSVIDLDLGLPTVQTETFAPTDIDLATLTLFTESAATSATSASATSITSVTSPQGFNATTATTATTSTTAFNGTSIIPTSTSPIDESINDYNSTDFNNDILYEHNVKRALHGVPALEWSDDLAVYAQNYADAYSCPANGTLIHSGGPYGENLASGYSSAFATVDAWYNEISVYDYANPGFSSATGHFTQVVWKDTTQVGCAYHVCDTAYHTYVICSYSPAGNVVNADWSIEVPEPLN